MHFSCEHCRQSLEIDDDQAGSAVQCPSCGRYISVPVAASEGRTSYVKAPVSRVSDAPCSDDARKVRVIDITMPFLSMVVFMVKWAFASIPAMIILALAYLLISGLFLGGCAAMMGMH